MSKTDVLKKYRPFLGLNEQLLTKVTENVTTVKVPKGNIIFKRGRTLSELFFLVDGEVDLINNEFGIERVTTDSERSASPLNEISPTVVSAIAKSRVTYFKVNASWLETLIGGSQVVDLMPPSLQESIEGSGEMEVCDISDSDDWMSCVLQSPVFRRIPLPQLQELFTRFERIAVSRGDKVVKEGTKGDYFYVVAQGSCHITNRTGSVDLQLSTGCFFGEEALISNATRNATVEMTTDGILNRLSANDFLELIKQPVLKFVNLDETGVFEKPFKILDVRMPVEYRALHFPGSLNIPLSRLRTYLKELGRGTAYLISAEAGSRAEIAAYVLCQAGFEVAILNSNPIDSSPELQLRAS